MIKIKFFGPFKKLMPKIEEDGFWHCEADGITVEEILQKTEICKETAGYTIMVNKCKKDKDCVLNNGDELLIMPLFAGG